MLSNGIVFHCFNCKFAANWEPGKPFSDNMKRLCAWLGASQDEIKKMVFEAMKTEFSEYEPAELPTIGFKEKTLPEESQSIKEWISSTSTDKNLIKVIEYTIERGLDPLDARLYWTPLKGFSDRLILPFWYNNIIVGYTARRITNHKPKYLSDQQPNFVYNIDGQDPLNRYVLVTEGPIDAIAIDGVALLTNGISEQQARIINNLGKEVIIIPDQDLAGLSVIKQAIEYNWSIAFPNWDDGIKDCAAAVQHYGKLFVIVDAIKTAAKHPATIKISTNQLETKLRRIDGYK